MVKEKIGNTGGERELFSGRGPSVFPENIQKGNQYTMKKFLTRRCRRCWTMACWTACGGKTTDKTVDRRPFYNTLAEEYGWAEDAASSGEEDIMMMNLEGDMLEGPLSRLADVATKQLIAKAPMISAVVNEIVLAECGTEE